MFVDLTRGRGSPGTLVNEDLSGSAAHLETDSPIQEDSSGLAADGQQEAKGEDKDKGKEEGKGRKRDSQEGKGSAEPPAKSSRAAAPPGSSQESATVPEEERPGTCSDFPMTASLDTNGVWCDTCGKPCTLDRVRVTSKTNGAWQCKGLRRHLHPDSPSGW